MRCDILLDAAFSNSCPVASEESVSTPVSVMSSLAFIPTPIFLLVTSVHGIESAVSVPAVAESGPTLLLALPALIASIQKVKVVFSAMSKIL